jgi:DNA-binding NtrC family response regulator
MRELFAQVEKIATATLSVLILGETGVGKEVIAERLHSCSGRKGRLVAINCAALPESLLESELFGHEKGAFTGAVQGKEGLFESADGGTLFLDEVGELPPGTQAKLLRVLEDRKVMRVGSRTAKSLDVRFVSATNRTLGDGEPGFRGDLYYRLCGITLEVPPLRERALDIVPLAQRFVTQGARALGKDPPPRLSREVLARLEAHSWPGNIRELRNVAERAVLLCDGPSIELSHLPPRFGAAAVSADAGVAAEASMSAADPRVLLLTELDRLERARVVDALSRCAGNQTQAAALLGISRRTLVARLGDYGLPRPRKR